MLFKPESLSAILLVSHVCRRDDVGAERENDERRASVRELRTRCGTLLGITHVGPTVHVGPGLTGRDCRRGERSEMPRGPLGRREIRGGLESLIKLWLSEEERTVGVAGRQLAAGVRVWSVVWSGVVGLAGLG